MTESAPRTLGRLRRRRRERSECSPAAQNGAALAGVNSLHCENLITRVRRRAATEPRNDWKGVVLTLTLQVVTDLSDARTLLHGVSDQVVPPVPIILNERGNVSSATCQVISDESLKGTPGQLRFAAENVRTLRHCPFLHSPHSLEPWPAHELVQCAPRLCG